MGNSENLCNQILKCHQGATVQATFEGPFYQDRPAMLTLFCIHAVLLYSISQEAYNTDDI